MRRHERRGLGQSSLREEFGGWSRTVSAQGCFVVEVVAHHGCGLVEEFGDLLVGERREDLGEEVGIVAAAGRDELLFDGGALFRRGTGQLVWSCLVCARTAREGAAYIVFFVAHVGGSWSVGGGDSEWKDGGREGK